MGATRQRAHLDHRLPARRQWLSCAAVARQDVPQQAHLDFTVNDLNEAELQVLALGAQKAPVQPGESWRVFLDPAGHPFCLVQASPEQMA